MKVIVTGATGFIGANYLRLWVQEGRSPRDLLILGRTAPKKSASVKALFLEDSSPLDAFAFESFDLAQPEQMKETLAHIEKEWKGAHFLHLGAMIHSAGGQTKIQDIVNRQATHVIAQWCQENASSMVFISSVVAFGGTILKKFRSESDFANFNPINWLFPYAKSKRLAHQELAEMKTKIPLFLLCPAIVHGRGETSKNSRSHLEAMLGGRLKLCPGGGGNIVSVDDVVSDIDACIKNKQPLASVYTRLLVGKNSEYKQYFEEFLGLAGRNQTLFRIPQLIGLWLSPFVFLMQFMGLRSTSLEGLVQGSLFLFFEQDEARAKNAESALSVAASEYAIKVPKKER